ncbi:hypothetical protein NKH28_31355 [Mesorhizobium sp. M1227]|uniref:hypothetical protein n=1 Tax=Mesorhizobium sp. M1227 TaxID=2957071 RepID=UPI003338BB6F
MTVAILLVALQASAEDTQGNDLVRQYQAVVREGFSSINDGVVPLYNAGANFRVGDLWDTKMTRLLDRTETCFPRLDLRSASSTLPRLHYTTEASLGFWLRLKSVFDLTSKGTLSTSVDVDFENVIEETAAEGDFTRSYQATTCPRAQGIIAQADAKPGDELPIIIGSLYRGKRRVTIIYGAAVDLKARADQIATAASGIPVEVGITAAITQGHSITVVDKDPVPLAFIPAFVPIRVSGATLGGQSDTEVKYEWLPFTPASIQSQKAVLPALFNAVDSGWSWENPSR